MDRQGPVPVVVTSPVPIPVIISSHDGTPADPPTTTPMATDAGQTTAPTTTAEQDRKTASQRDINRVWEDTQKRIALWVIGTALCISASLSLLSKWVGAPDVQLASIVFIYGVANLVTGFYFGRTNHQRTGGVDGNQAGSR